MKHWLPCLISILCASVASAEPPASPSVTRKAVSALVNEQLVRPLARAESKRKIFSRVATVPIERRVRVIDSVARTDARGRRFVRFAIDVRRRRNDDAAWQRNALRGCAYPADKEVFVRRGDVYFSAASVLGEDVDSRTDVCRGGAPEAAKLASAER